MISGCMASESVFESFVREVDGEACRSVDEARKSAQRKGERWEEFCLLFLREVEGVEAWLLKTVPSSVLEEAGLKRRDVGIDILARGERGGLVAIQCKFRGSGRRVSWREVSTFYALCSRTGPWEKKIVMTNGSGVRREGRGGEGEATMCRGRFLSLRREEWAKMAGLGEGRRLCDSDSGSGLVGERERMREARERWLSSLWSH